MSQVSDAFKLQKDCRKWGGKYRDEETGAEIRYYISKNVLKAFLHPTNEYIDWKTNFSMQSEFFILDGHNIGRIAKGYGKAARNLNHHLLNDLKAVDEVELVGFSMGGGIAESMAVNLLNLTYIKKITCTNIDGAKSLNKRLVKNLKNCDRLSMVKIKSKNSIVNKLPFNFVEIGVVYVIGKKLAPIAFSFIGFKTSSGNEREGFFMKHFTIPAHEWNNIEEACKGLWDI